MNQVTLEIAFKEWWEASYGRPPGTHAVMTHAAGRRTSIGECQPPTRGYHVAHP
jgi:hypothetical protein